MDKNEVIRRFCTLSMKVRDDYFNSQYAADCFCTEWFHYHTWETDGKVLQFIEQAVKEKMERDGPPPSRWEND